MKKSFSKGSAVSRWKHSSGSFSGIAGILPARFISIADFSHPDNLRPTGFRLGL
jgi:hypothetical protein